MSNGIGIYWLVIYMMVSAFSSTTVGQSITDHTDIYFKEINNLSDLPDNVTTTLFEDDEGFLWIGTQDGIVRYDGYDFVHYRSRKDDVTSFSGMWVNSIVQVSSGDIWVGSREGISIHNKKTGNFTDLSTLTEAKYGINQKEIFNMIYSHHGVWIPKSKTLTLMNPETYEARHYQHEYVDGKKLTFSEVEIIDDDRAFVGTSRGVFLLQISAGIFTKIDSSYSKSIQDLFLDSRDNLWISTIHAGLRVIENATTREPQTLSSRMISDGITRQTIQVNKGEIWVQKYLKGIQIIDLDTLSPRQHLRRDRVIDHSLNSDSVSKMIVSKQGLIIVGLWGGGIQFYDRQLNYINPFLIKGEGLGVNDGVSIGKMQYSPTSGIWLFGKSQFINLDSSNKFQSKPWPELEKLIGEGQWPESAVLAKNDAKEEMLYALSNQGRLVEFHLKENSGRRLNKGKLINCLSSTEMAIDKNKRLWFNCASPSLVLRYDTDTGNVIEIHGDNNSPIHLNKIAVKSEDQYWLIADNGLFIASNIFSAKPDITSVDFFNGMAIYDLKPGKENDIWLDTSLGVYRGSEQSGNWEFSAMASQLVEKEDSLFGNMMVDQQGWIWGRDGVLDTDALVFHRFREKDGEDIGSSWLGGAIAIDEDTLVVAGDMQLAVYEPKKFSVETYIPNLIATGLAINNEKQKTIPTTIELSEDRRSIAVDFSLVDYRRPSAHKYRYKLDGYDDAWIYTDGSNRKAVYANLPVGHYLLRVEGVVDGKKWGRSSIGIPITRLPAYHETLWFKTSGLLLVLGFLWFLHKLNLRRKLRLLQKREVELNELVNLRTQELELSLNNLKLTQKKLVDSEKLALLGRLVRGLAHELNTPLSVVKMAESMLHNMLSEARQFIGEQSEGQANKFQQKSEKALHLINENLNRSINLIAHFKSVDVEDGENQASWFNVGVLLAQITSNVEAQVALKGDSNLEVFCNQGSLIKVIDELLKNAQLHGGDNIEIEYLVKTSAVTRKEELTICVNDNNKGISDDVLEKMFQPFYSTHSGGGSPGLGLYMVENTVRFVMGGEVNVHSEEGKHTSFEIILPCESRQNVKESA